MYSKNNETVLFDIDNIYCVDAYKAIKELPDKSVDLIVTDPPYQIQHLAGGGYA